MTEREEMTEQLNKELGIIEAYKRLERNPDFLAFKKFIEDKREGYRNLLEYSSDETKLNTVRGGLITIREILNTFESQIKREADIKDKLKQLSQ